MGIVPMHQHKHVFKNLYGQKADKSGKDKADNFHYSDYSLLPLGVKTGSSARQNFEFSSSVRVTL